VSLSDGFWGNVDPPLDISGNSSSRIAIEGGFLMTHTEAGNATIRIHDNGGSGRGMTGVGTAQSARKSAPLGSRTR